MDCAAFKELGRGFCCRPLQALHIHLGRFKNVVHSPPTSCTVNTKPLTISSSTVESNYYNILYKVRNPVIARWYQSEFNLAILQIVYFRAVDCLFCFKSTCLLFGESFAKKEIIGNKRDLTATLPFMAHHIDGISLS